MGGLQSVLGDCQLGQVPAYLQRFHKGGDGGDEAYMVYGDRLPFQKQATDGEDGSRLYYSGPSQRYVRANLLAKKGQQAQKQVLQDIVDLCVDGIDAPEARSGQSRAKPAAGVPGGQTFAPPQPQPPLSSEVWQREDARSSERAADNARSVDGRVEEIVESYPDDLKKLLRQEEQQGGAADSSPYQSEIDDEEDADSASTGTGDEPLASSRHEQRSAAAVVAAPQEAAEEGRAERAAMQVCRDEEGKLLERLTIVVHPSEEPETPPEAWFLLEAEWFREWSAFLRGGPRPGKISNARLINAEEGAPWPGKAPGTHYVGLDQVAWELLSEIYGADMPVRRPLFDLYASE